MNASGSTGVGSLTLSAILALAGVGGCHLFGDYGPPTNLEVEPADTVDADRVGPRDTSDARGTEPDTRPDSDTGADTREADGADLEDDTGDTREIEVVDTTDTGDDADDGGDVDGGLPENQCPAGEPSYRIRPFKTTPSIDATCTDAEFGHAPSLPMPDAMTIGTEPANTSNNTADCRLLWKSGKPPRMHGCCKVEDEDLHENSDDDDPVESLFGSDGYIADDRIETNMRCDLQRERGGCQYKTFTNMRAPTPVHFAFDIKAGYGREQRDDNFSGAAKPTSDGYVIEWTSDFGFSRQSGDTGLCNFAVFDVDDQKEDGQAVAFGPADSINYPEHWGCCFYE